MKKLLLPCLVAITVLFSSCKSDDFKTCETFYNYYMYKISDIDDCGDLNELFKEDDYYNRVQKGVKSFFDNIYDDERETYTQYDALSDSEKNKLNTMYKNLCDSIQDKASLFDCQSEYVMAYADYYNLIRETLENCNNARVLLQEFDNENRYNTSNIMKYLSENFCDRTIYSFNNEFLTNRDKDYCQKIVSHKERVTENLEDVQKYGGVVQDLYNDFIEQVYPVINYHSAAETRGYDNVPCYAGYLNRNIYYVHRAGWSEYNHEKNNEWGDVIETYRLLSYNLNSNFGALAGVHGNKWAIIFVVCNNKKEDVDVISLRDNKTGVVYNYDIAYSKVEFNTFWVGYERQITLGGNEALKFINKVSSLEDYTIAFRTRGCKDCDFLIKNPEFFNNIRDAIIYNLQPQLYDLIGGMY